VTGSEVSEPAASSSGPSALIQWVGRNGIAVSTVALLVAFGVFRFWQALMPPQGVWEDTYSYESVASYPFLSTSFWAGARPPLSPLLWKITGSPTPYVVIQTFIAVAAWGLLAITVGSLARGQWQRILAAGVVLAFACTLPVAEWDWSVLSESLALSALAAIFAFAIRYARTAQTEDACAILIAATAFILDRDEDIWTVALMGLATIVGALLMWRKKAKSNAGAATDSRGADPDIIPATPAQPLPRPGPRPRPRPRRIRQTAVLGILLVVLAAACEVPVVTSQRDSQYILDILVVRIFPFPSRVAWFSDHGMPDAQAVNKLASETQAVPGFAPVIAINLQASNFTPLARWIDSDGPTTYALWLLEHPGYAIDAPFVKPPLTFNNAGGDLSFYSAPGRLGTVWLDRVLFPGLWGELLILAIALFFATRRSMWRRAFWVVAVLAALGPVAMLIAWQGEAQEVTRHMVVGSVETRLAVLLLLLIAVLGRSEPNTLSVLDPPEPDPQVPAIEGASDTQAL